MKEMDVVDLKKFAEEEKRKISQYVRVVMENHLEEKRNGWNKYN